MPQALLALPDQGWMLARSGSHPVEVICVELPRSGQLGSVLHLGSDAMLADFVAKAMSEKDWRGRIKAVAGPHVWWQASSSEQSSTGEWRLEVPARFDQPWGPLSQTVWHITLGNADSPGQVLRLNQPLALHSWSDEGARRQDFIYKADADQIWLLLDEGGWSKLPCWSLGTSRNQVYARSGNTKESFTQSTIMDGVFGYRLARWAALKREKPRAARALLANKARDWQSAMRFSLSVHLSQQKEMSTSTLYTECTVQEARRWLQNRIAHCQQIPMPIREEREKKEIEVRPAISAEKPHGWVYKISGIGDGRHLYLAGSLHRLPPGSPLPKPLETAYTACSQLWCELPTEYALLKSCAKTPALEATRIARAAADAAGWVEGTGLEDRMRRRALADGKVLVPMSDGLETADFQMRLLSDMPLETQKAWLAKARQEKDWAARLNALHHAWLTGDGQQLAALDEESALPGLRSFLLERRNQLWVQPIEALLLEKDTTLLLVGMEHLRGPNSLPLLLKERGWTVERLLSE